MNDYKSIWNVNIRKSVGCLVFVAILVFLLSISFVSSIPTAPVFIGTPFNTTFTSNIVNRSVDTKGTITTIVLSSTQQDQKWKAYVGNVSGTLALANAGGQAIYDWSSGTPTGEVYVSRFSSITWSTIGCATQGSVDTDQTALGMISSSRDSINATFNYTTHKGISVSGAANLTGCRSTATYVSGAAQVMGPAASFQEVLLRDTGTSNLVYATFINDNTLGYDSTSNYDFQIIVGENESSSTPVTYYFWVELG